MIDRHSEILFSQLSELIAARMGLYFPKARWHDLERGIASAAPEFGLKDVESCIQWLLSSPWTQGQISTLAAHLTVGETYFFREKRGVDLLEEHILPELIGSRRGAGKHLRIWSAGCATGEEPYSVAILLHQVLPDLKDWDITLLATDMNPRFLQRASEGVYGEWSFRDTPIWIKERYFKKKESHRFEILPQIQRMVTFSYLNLAEDADPSFLNHPQAIDVIFCRNVLIYFAPEQAKRVIQNLYRSLVEGGWLIVSPSEASYALVSPFAPVSFPGAILYRKGGQRARPLEALPARQPFLPEPVRRSDFSLPLAAAEIAAALPEDPTAQKPQPTPSMEALELHGQGRYTEGARRLPGALPNPPESPEAMLLRARTCANRGKLAEALHWSEKALAADRLNLGLHYLRAMVLQEQGTLDEAVTSLKRALYLDPGFVLAHFALGNLALRQGKRKESEKYFENVLSLLRAYRPGDLLPESEGMTAGRLMEILRSKGY